MPLYPKTQERVKRVAEDLAGPLALEGLEMAEREPDLWFLQATDRRRCKASVLIEIAPGASTVGVLESVRTAHDLLLPIVQPRS